jgi:hypothetical protein
VLPESNNCYGRIKFSSDLDSLGCRLSERGWRTHFQAASSARHESLKVDSDAVGLLIKPAQGGQHFFSGTFDGTRGERALVKLSSDLQEMEIPYRVELYDDSDSLYRELKFADSFLD